MRNASGTKHQSERSELRVLPAVALAVQPIQQQGKKREFVRVHGELAGSRMAQVREDGVALLPPTLNCAKEAAGAHVLAGGSPVRGGIDGGFRQGEAPGKRLRLF